MKKLILSLILGITLLSGCKLRQVTQYVDRWHETVKTDSIYQLDKDTMYIRKNGDTIFVNRVKTRVDYRYIYRNKTDSVYKDRVITVTEYKEKKVTAFWSWFDYIILFGIASFAVYKIIGFIRPRL
jgi:hypothetical protein